MKEQTTRWCTRQVAEIAKQMRAWGVTRLIIEHTPDGKYRFDFDVEPFQPRTVNRRQRIGCPHCGTSVSVSSSKRLIHSHRLRNGEWCPLGNTVSNPVSASVATS